MTYDMHPERRGGRGHRRGPGPEGRRHGGPDTGHGRGQGRRRHRGHVRVAVLTLLSEEPMHGYQLMQAVAERTDGAWRPSPGAVYPTLSQLEDEGLVSVTREGGRKLATITEAGRAVLADDPPEDPFAAATQQGGTRPDLRGALEEVHGATRQLGRHGSDAQVAAAAEVLATARRALYLLLADGPGTTTSGTTTPGTTTPGAPTPGP